MVSTVPSRADRRRVSRCPGSGGNSAAITVAASGNMAPVSFSTALASASFPWEVPATASPALSRPKASWGVSRSGREK